MAGYVPQPPRLSASALSLMCSVRVQIWPCKEHGVCACRSAMRLFYFPAPSSHIGYIFSFLLHSYATEYMSMLVAVKARCKFHLRVESLLTSGRSRRVPTRRASRWPSRWHTAWGWERHTSRRRASVTRWRKGEWRHPLRWWAASHVWRREWWHVRGDTTRTWRHTVWRWERWHSIWWHRRYWRVSIGLSSFIVC